MTTSCLYNISEPKTQRHPSWEGDVWGFVTM
jgi:hypothetical protein